MQHDNENDIQGRKNGGCATHSATFAVLLLCLMSMPIAANISIGNISGTPTRLGNYSYQIKLKNGSALLSDTVLNKINANNVLMDCQETVCDYRFQVNASMAFSLNASTLAGLYSGNGVSVAKIFYEIRNSTTKVDCLALIGNETVPFCYNLTTTTITENTNISNPFTKGENRTYVIRFVKDNTINSNGKKKYNNTVVDIYHSIFGQNRTAAALWNSTGGTCYANDTWTICKFTSNGSFNVTGTITNASVLVVAGGGAGGERHGGGGGGGGYIFNTTMADLTGNYTVVVGAGGVGSATTNLQTSGQNSSFGSLAVLNAMGGGRGGGQVGSANGPSIGGSGGGGGAAGTSVTGAAGLSGQGYAGGNGVEGSTYRGGAGGGCNQVGAPSNTSAIAIASVGCNNSISNASINYSSGGAGSSYYTGPAVPANGSPNTGTGGGGCGGNLCVGGNGSSGVVIIKYLTYTSATAVCGDVLSTAGTTYTMTANSSVNGTNCLNVTAANITIDCAGYSITGNNTTGTYGIWSVSQNGTTIKNCAIANFSNGILLKTSSFGSVINTSIDTTFTTTGYGLYLWTTDLVTINNLTTTTLTSPSIFMRAGITNTSIANSNLKGSSAVYGTIGTFDGTLASSNITVANNTIDGSAGGMAISLAGAAYGWQNSLFINNTIQNATTLVSFGDYGIGNTLCLNNFSNVGDAIPTYYVNDGQSLNFYNCTTGGKNQGNLWADVANGTVAITGTVASSKTGLYIGNAGAIPYNKTRSLKFQCPSGVNCQDYAPLTPFVPSLNVSSRTLPSGNQLLSNASTIAGYCNATSANSTKVYYNYTWYLNGTANTSGIFQNNTTSYGMFLNVSRAFGNDSNRTDPYNANDTNYATLSAHTLIGNSTLYWNYTIPINATNQTFWQTQHGNATAPTNETLPALCANQTPIQLKIVTNNSNTTTVTSTTLTTTNASTFTNVEPATAYGCNWTSPENATYNDSDYAKCTVPNDYTNTSLIVATNWGFNIPANAVIVGVYSYYSAKAATTNQIQDRYAFLWNNSAFMGTNTTNSTYLTTSDTTVSHGGPTSLWGATLNPTTVNLPTFGVAYSLTKNDTTGTSKLISLNVINMTIYYTITGLTNYSQSSKFCWTGSAWTPLGTNSTTVNNTTGSDVYEQDVWFNTSATSDKGFANGTETLVNNRTTDITTGNWTFGCNATDGVNSVVTANSSLLNITAAADSCSCPASPANWTIQLKDSCNITSSCNIPGFYLIYNGTGNITFNNISSKIVITAKGEKLTNIIGTCKRYFNSSIVRNYTG